MSDTHFFFSLFFNLTYTHHSLDESIYPILCLTPESMNSQYSAHAYP